MPTVSPPPSRIYLLRHAEAAPAVPGQKDFDRPLNDNGYAAAEIVADEAADKNYVPDVVVASTALRCRQTADAIRRSLSPSTEFRFVDALYNATPATYLELISAQANVDSVMLVGHNPNIQLALEALIGHEAFAAALPNGFPTAGLAIVDWTPAGWVLIDFVVE
ncbi:MAG: histidine phosphatase family protein [Rhizobiaceae bacterium]|nr:histidine phosphatase family protein [Rhizobiaceae bacterium]